MSTHPLITVATLMRTHLCVLLVVLIGYTVASAQAPATRGPVFEVASVKRNVSGRIGGGIQVPPAGTLTFTNVMLRILIRDAYQIDPYAESHKFDAGPYARIVGRGDGGSQPDVPRFDGAGQTTR